MVQRTVATRYWTAFVGEPLSRLQTGTTVLATAPPAGKAGVLGTLRARVTAVGDWAVGRRGPERAVIATLALAYVLPFALALVALAMLASCAQTLVWLLALAGPLVAPLAVDPRHRRAVLRWWLVPLAAALALLAGAALASLVVIRVAELTHAADAYLGMLLAGSTVPAPGRRPGHPPPPPPAPGPPPGPARHPFPPPARHPPVQAGHPPGRCRLMATQHPNHIRSARHPLPPRWPGPPAGGCWPPPPARPAGAWPGRPPSPSFWPCW